MKTILLLLVTFMLIGCNHSDSPREDVTLELHYLNGETITTTISVHEGTIFEVRDYRGAYYLSGACDKQIGRQPEIKMPGVIIFRVLDRVKT